jgi:heat shock protein HtpX
MPDMVPFLAAFQVSRRGNCMSLSSRALIAILLMIGFYLLALGVVALLLWIPYAEWAYLNRLDSRIAIACLGGAAIVGFSILPRRDRFAPPGPRVDAAAQPRLLAELAAIAKGMGQEMPHEVYLIPDMNAWVAQRGGLMGFGSRRVMALGLPLMRLLTVSQFRAVLAHEFGHFYGGDTKLGPWIYKTRSAIGRTLAQLARHKPWLIFLFEWYANMFLRVTFAISRAQEYAADRLSAQFAGAGALITGLKQIHRGGVAWAPYLHAEILPVLAAGYSPPVAAGFVRFLQSPAMQTPLEESLKTELAEGKADPFDSHPSLPERLAVLHELPEGVAEDNRLASDLLDNFDSTDTSLFLPLVDHPLKPVAWEDVLGEIWIPGWRRQVASQRDALGDMVVPELLIQLREGHLDRRLRNPEGFLLDQEQRADMAAGVAGCALALALSADGWTFHTMPGEMYCEKKGQRLEPFVLTRQLTKGEITAEQWRELCATTGIMDLKLTPVTVPAN